jgi:hypothetical protein
LARARWAMCIYRRKLRRILRKRAARSCCSRPPRRFIRSTTRVRRRSAFLTLPVESGRPRLNLHLNLCRRTSAKERNGPNSLKFRFYLRLGDVCEITRVKSRRSTAVAGAFNRVCAEPSLVLEQGAKRQGNLPVLIPLGVGRKRAGVSQDVAPVLDEFGLTVERMV